MKLTEQEKDKLRTEFDKLNQAVVSATLERAVFLKENLQKMSYYEKGESIYDLDNDVLLGKVVSTFIYGFNPNSIDDNSLSLNFNYDYEVSHNTNIVDNTSRQYVHHGNLKDLKHSLDLKRWIAENKLKNLEVESK